MTITITDILLLLIVCGALVIGNGFLVGWLVYRTKREHWETLSPPKPVETSQRAVNMDEFAPIEEPGLSPVLKASMERMQTQFGIDVLKGEK